MAEITLPGPGLPYVTITAAAETSLLDLPAALVVDLYKLHGALLLRAFPADLDAFRLFAGQFCVSSVFNESPDRKLLDEVHNIQSVNAGSAAFPLHPELSREPWKPDVCFFHCLVPPRGEGETTLCDGVELVRLLPEEVRAGFSRHRLLYIQVATGEMLQYWLGTEAPSDAQLANPPPDCPYSFVRAQGAIVRSFSRPALHRPMFTDAPAFGNFLLFARYFLGMRAFPALETGRPVPEPWVEAAKQAGDRLTAPIAWRKGDLLMLDNSRFMHGRNAIADTGERMIASYFGYLNFAPPNPEEPPNPPWRRASFRPPQPAAPRAAI